METVSSQAQIPPVAKAVSWQVIVFTWAIKNKRYIFWLIRLNYAFILGMYLLAGYAAFTKSPAYYSFYYTLALYFSRTAIVLLGVAILPGILGRFGIKWQATRVITFFRRQVGISVFLLAFTHYSIVRLLPVLSGQIPFVFPYSFFEMLGFFAICILGLMYLTSNNWSMTKLGPWWKRLHRFVYVVLWLLVFHTGLQKISIWTLLILIFAVLETSSLIFAWRMNMKKVDPQISVQK